MFEDIIGNDKTKEVLTKSIINNKTSHSYLFIGIEGIGKKKFAQNFAKAILCTSESKPCNTCKSCIEFDSFNNPDYMILEPDGNIIKIEQIRNLQKSIQEKPIISNRKVYIINDADRMTKEAQNCLLKTLEEPPEFATIILIGTNESAFLSTIKSRCMILHFNKIENKEIVKYLNENYGLRNITPNMLNSFQGSIGKAIKLKDKQEEYQQVDNFVNNLHRKDLIDVLNLSEVLYNSKDEIVEILEYMNSLLLNLSIENYRYTNCIQIVENTKKRLQQNSNYDMCIDNMVFNMWEEIN